MLEIMITENKFKMRVRGEFRILLGEFEILVSDKKFLSRKMSAQKMIGRDSLSTKTENQNFLILKKGEKLVDE